MPILDQQISLDGVLVQGWDVLAWLWFMLLWILYAGVADYHRRHSDKSLMKIMYRHRLRWMNEMLKRDNRMFDAKVASNVMGSVTFFASTSIFILIGLMTMLGYSDKGVVFLSHLPFAVPTDERLWDLKVIWLMAIFIYAFYKHTWAMRQFNYTSILIAGAPIFKKENHESRKEAVRITKIVSLAAKNFNQGLRAYYFGLASLTWFIHPLLLMVVSAWVVFVLFHREFNSTTLRVLSE